MRAARARHGGRGDRGAGRWAIHDAGFPGSRSSRPSASATTMSMQPGRPRTASPSPTRRTCSPRRSPTPRSGSCCAPCASSRRPSATCAPANGAQKDYPLSKATLAQPHRRAWSAWAASGRRSRAGSTPCRCRWSIIRGGRRRACPTGTIRTSSTWRATSTCCWSSRRAGAETRNLINAEVLEALGPRRHPHQHGARLGGRRAGADQGAAGQDHPVGRSRCLSRASPRCRRS